MLEYMWSQGGLENREQEKLENSRSDRWKEASLQKNKGLDR